MNSVELLKQLIKSTKGFGCITFALRDYERLIFGRNFDFMIDFGHVTIKKPNYPETSIFIESK